MKKSLTLFVLLCTLCMSTNATLLFNESFNYTTGDLYNQGGWVKYGSHAKDPIQVVNTPLTYAGYQTTAVGYAAKIGSSDTQGQDLMKHIGHLANTNGNVAYIGALLKVDAVGTNYFLAVCDSTSSAFADGRTPSEKIRLYALEGSTDGKFKFALGKGNDKYVTTETEYDLNSTYLVVIKYEFVVATGDESTTKNDDPIYLFVNPSLTAEPSTSTAVATLLGDTYGSDIAWRGANALELKQGQTFSKACPTVTVDNIRIATTWNELLTESGDTPDPTPTATITPSTTKLEFGNLYVDDTKTLKFTVKGTDLTGDITLASNNAEVVLDKTTITQAEAEAGVEVTATLTAATAGEQTATITLSSVGATNVTIAVSWTAIAVTKVATIAALKAEVSTNPEALFLYTGEAVITYYEVTGEYSTPTFYVEDATGAVCIYDYYENTCKVGDKIKDFMVVASSEEAYRGLPFSFVSTVTIVSSGNEWTPQVVTLQQLQDNAADYLMELVKVENVTLDQTEANYKAGNNAISKDGTTAVINLTSDNTLIGTAKPAIADIVGISYYTSGYNIRVRTDADIVAKTTPTSIETIALDQLTGEYEIYTVSGQRTDALQPGVNIIRQGEKTYKVIR